MKIENGDIVCFRLRVVDKEQAAGLLESLLDTIKGGIVSGLKLSAVSLDDVFEERNELREELDKWEDDHGPFDCLHCEDDDEEAE